MSLDEEKVSLFRFFLEEVKFSQAQKITQWWVGAFFKGLKMIPSVHIHGLLNNGTIERYLGVYEWAHTSRQCLTNILSNFGAGYAHRCERWEKRFFVQGVQGKN